MISMITRRKFKVISTIQHLEILTTMIFLVSNLVRMVVLKSIQMARSGTICSILKCTKICISYFNTPLKAR